MHHVGVLIGEDGLDVGMVPRYVVANHDPVASRNTSNLGLDLAGTGGRLRLPGRRSSMVAFPSPSSSANRAHGSCIAVMSTSRCDDLSCTMSVP